MNNDDHIELAKLLNEISGMVAISNYDCDLMNQLYKSPKWTKIKSPLKTIHSTKDTRQEVLWVNFNLKNTHTSYELFK